MIPHEREMVERLKDKPFALVSISVDDEKKTLTDFLAKEPMPWTHWWNGAEGKLIDTLNIEHYPTIFVARPRGVIRYKEIRGEELEKAVNGCSPKSPKKLPLRLLDRERPRRPAGQFFFSTDTRDQGDFRGR